MYISGMYTCMYIYKSVLVSPMATIGDREVSLLWERVTNRSSGNDFTVLGKT